MSEQKRIPRHVAIIMDGNGRWAAQHGLERFEGHIRGVESVRRAIQAATRHGVRYLTLYAFSTENWGRPRRRGRCFDGTLLQERNQRNARTGRSRSVRADHRRQKPFPRKSKTPPGSDRKPNGCRGTPHAATGPQLLFPQRNRPCDAGSGARAAAGILSPEEISEQTVSEALYTAGCPDPDLLIRTSGEQRLSNFLLWQAAYAELCFTPVLWPDFTEEDFAQALDEYARRERRFGLVKNNERIR